MILSSPCSSCAFDDSGMYFLLTEADVTEKVVAPSFVTLLDSPPIAPYEARRRTQAIRTGPISSGYLIPVYAVVMFLEKPCTRRLLNCSASEIILLLYHSRHFELGGSRHRSD